MNVLEKVTFSSQVTDGSDREDSPSCETEQSDWPEETDEQLKEPGK